MWLFVIHNIFHLITTEANSAGRHDFYIGKDYLEKFCTNLKEHITGIMDYEKKEMLPLTKKEGKSYKKQKLCHI